MEVKETYKLLKRIIEYRQNVEKINDCIEKQAYILSRYQNEVEDELIYLQDKQKSVKEERCLAKLKKDEEVENLINLEWRNGMLKEVQKVRKILNAKVVNATKKLKIEKTI